MKLSDVDPRVFKHISLKEMLSFMIEDATTIVLDGDGPYEYYVESNGDLFQIAVCDLISKTFAINEKVVYTFRHQIVESHLYVRCIGIEHRLKNSI